MLERRKQSRRSYLILAALSVGLASILVTAAHTPSAGAVLPTLDTVQQQLGSAYGIEINQTPNAATATAGVSQTAAEATALSQFGQPATTAVTSYAVNATATRYGDPQSDGSLKLRISNRAVWLVLIPDQQVPIRYPKGQTGPPSYTATLAVLVDATTGDYLMAVTV